MDDGCPEGLHKPDLAPAVARADGNGQRPELFGAVLEAETAGEEPVPHGVLENVFLADAHHVQATGHLVCPFFQVVHGMENNRGVACGTGGRMEPYRFRQVRT